MIMRWNMLRLITFIMLSVDDCLYHLPFPNRHQLLKLQYFAMLVLHCYLHSVFLFANLHLDVHILLILKLEDVVFDVLELDQYQTSQVFPVHNQIHQVLKQQVTFLQLTAFI